jgi:hypothetical protein
VRSRRVERSVDIGWRGSQLVPQHLADAWKLGLGYIGLVFFGASIAQRDGLLSRLQAICQVGTFGVPRVLLEVTL